MNWLIYEVAIHELVICDRSIYELANRKLVSYEVLQTTIYSLLKALYKKKNIYHGILHLLAIIKKNKVNYHKCIGY